MNRLPDFIIAGVGKSGSTSLWNYLKEHPDICGAREKEPLFFTRVRGRRDGGNWNTPTRSGRYDQGLDWYRTLFEHCDRDQCLGEASVSYFYVEDAPELIERHVPDVKLIFILRDPVDRFYSHYWQARKGAKEVPSSFEALVENPDHRYFKLFEWVSSYKVHLERFRDCFPDRQIGILFHEDLVSDPLELLGTCYDFLEVEGGFVPGNLEERFNPASLPRNRWFQKILGWSRGVSFKKVLPDPIRNRLSRLIGYLSELNKREIDYPAINPAIRGRLLERFEEDVDYVEGLTGRTLTSWRRVDTEE